MLNLICKCNLYQRGLLSQDFNLTILLFINWLFIVTFSTTQCYFKVMISFLIDFDFFDWDLRHFILVFWSLKALHFPIKRWLCILGFGFGFWFWRRLRTYFLWSLFGWFPNSGKDFPRLFLWKNRFHSTQEREIYLHDVFLLWFLEFGVCYH